jgi:hypothetical protein
MVMLPMPVHPRSRFGIGAIRIRGITLRYLNARSPGNKLFSDGVKPQLSKTLEAAATSGCARPRFHKSGRIDSGPKNARLPQRVAKFDPASGAVLALAAKMVLTHGVNNVGS